MSAGRLENCRRDVIVLVEQPSQPVDVVLLSQQYVAGNARQYAGSRAAVEMIGKARSHVIVPTVEMMLEPDDLGLAAEGAGEPHRHQGRLGAGRGKPHALGRR